MFLGRRVDGKSGDQTRNRHSSSIAVGEESTQVSTTMSRKFVKNSAKLSFQTCFKFSTSVFAINQTPGKIVPPSIIKMSNIPDTD